MSQGSGAPLGVFDSGLGGLTVVRAILRELPSERIVYLGDTARVPYGTRSPDTVIRYARGCARFLTGLGVKAVVVACNTASAVAVETLRAELDLPVLGVVVPGAQAAIEQAERLSAESRQLPRIGVLGTAGTVASGAYERAVGQLSTRYEVITQAAPLLVPLVEEGWLEGTVPDLVVTRYVEPLVARDVRVLVLGCTHYPLLVPVVESVTKRLVGSEIAIVDSAQATAKSLRRLLEAAAVSATPAAPSAEERLRLFVTDLPASFSSMAERFLGAGAMAVQQIDL